ncbi:MAG: PD-(D/E)XK nuclease domain-containing protein [Bacteroidales bacterium]|nr:PD-(D/E)XK nuclease domain-containing protein [Bacteroidales bacterium]
MEEKDYATAYKNDGRKIIKLGINFDEEKRNIVDWKILAQHK